jgi:hypothetical protein
MNYKQAQKALKVNKGLIGQFLNKQKIDALLIIPKDESHLTALINYYLKGFSPGLLLGTFTEFKIIVLLNLSAYEVANSHLFWKDLAEVLPVVKT